MFKGICCESFLSLWKVVSDWGIIGVCIDMFFKYFRERESVVDGSLVYRIIFVR